MQRTNAFLAAAAALALSACGSETSGEFTTEDGGNAEYTVDKATGETSMTLEGPDGTASLRSGADVPIALPQGFSLFPGTKVITNTVIKKDDGEGTMIIFEAGAAADAILAHYRKQAEAAGYAIQIDMNTNGTRMIGGEREADGATVSVTVNPGDGQTATGQLILGKKAGG